MKIVQVTHALTYGDAASNQVISLDRLLKKTNIESAIYAGKIDPLVQYPVRKYSELKPARDIILVYHFSTGTSFVNQILDYPYPIVMYYHNITPAHYFLGNAWGSFIASIKGRRQLKKLKEKTFFSWAASEYSRKELEDYGFTNTSVLPILIDFESYRQASIDETIITRYRDSTNLLCVGRITSHKRQEDAIRALYYYKNFINMNSRLFIVGGAKKSYLAKLQELAKSLKIEKDVIFTGKVSFDELCTYYRLADVFLSMSQHEGFCVPLIESMVFEKPVVAFDATAVPYTMGSSGILYNKNDYGLVAEIINQVIKDLALRESVIEAQRGQLQMFTISKIQGTLEHDLQIIFSLSNERNQANE